MTYAKKFATWAHASATYGGRPYLTHLEEVAAIAVPFADEIVSASLLEAVSYLHDTIEDTPVTRLFLDELFGGTTAKAVALVTDPDLGSRRERKAALHRRLKHLEERDVASRAALIVKLSDRVANVRACVRDSNLSLMSMYAKEYAAFRDAVWRPELCAHLWEELDHGFSKP
jgi:(p)ppGpp synthase/HD superfamily hydrolase